MGILKNFEGDGHENEHVNGITHVNQLINTNHFSDSSSSSSSSSSDEEVEETVQQTPIVPTTPSISNNTPITTNRTPKIKKNVPNMPKPILHVKNLGGKKSQGHRQARRHENMCFLLNLAKDLDEDFAEVNINDLVDTTISAFAQLLLSKNKMKVWNEFIELSEQQQEEIVKIATNKKTKKKINQDKNKDKFNNDNKRNSFSSDETFETFVIIKNHTTTNDNNDFNHDFNKQEEADACFHRIDSNIRHTLKNMLKRHHLPLERISNFEDDIIPFFKEHPDSVYLRDLNNGFDRMLLHAVCQYLNLISKSFTRDGERYTQVENRRITFIPPIILLSEYVKTLNETMKVDL